MSALKQSSGFCGIVLAAGLLAAATGPASAQTLAVFPLFTAHTDQYAPPVDQYTPQTDQYAPQPDQSGDATDQLPEQLRRQIVSYPATEPPGTIIIDTAHTYLYLTLGGGQAMRYGIGVGRQGFTWSGVEKISRKAEWPDWIPPVEMVARQPYLPRWVAGGPGNPLGARALYLGNSDYRIHGTNDPTTIGKHVSSGCIRLQNADVIDLYSRVGIGTKVVVLPNDANQAAASDGRRVMIDATHSGPMTARIVVSPDQQDAPNGGGSSRVY
jgi:lipoprotein-anchoring transpeptidase ErfK/SrfK